MFVVFFALVGFSTTACAGVFRKSTPAELLSVFFIACGVYIICSIANIYTVSKMANDSLLRGILVTFFTVTASSASFTAAYTTSPPGTVVPLSGLYLLFFLATSLSILGLALVLMHESESNIPGQVHTVNLKHAIVSWVIGIFVLIIGLLIVWLV